MTITPLRAKCIRLPGAARVLAPYPAAAQHGDAALTTCRWTRNFKRDNS
jgi:hypothetical protein